MNKGKLYFSSGMKYQVFLILFKKKQRIFYEVVILQFSKNVLFGRSARSKVLVTPKFMLK